MEYIIVTYLYEKTFAYTLVVKQMHNSFVGYHLKNFFSIPSCSINPSSPFKEILLLLKPFPLKEMLLLLKPFQKHKRLFKADNYLPTHERLFTADNYQHVYQFEY